MAISRLTLTHRVLQAVVLIHALGFVSTVSAATVEVTVGGVSGGGPYGEPGDPSFMYDPSQININVGDSVQFTNSGGAHNVNFTGLGVKCANGCSDTGGNGNPSPGNWSFTRTFTAAGTFPFKCDNHGDSLGMKGTITVHGTSASPGTLALGSASYSTSETSGSAVVTVARSGGSDGAVSASSAATAGTAVVGTNFQPASGTLNWAAGEVASKTFQVTVLNDTSSTNSTTVHLAISAPTGGASLGLASATLTITNAVTSAAGVLGLSQATYTVGESAGTASIAVTRTGGSSGPVSVHYSTTAGTATSGSDFQPASGTLNWTAGDSANKSFSVPVLTDGATESTETVDLHLSAPTGSATLGRSSAVLNIQDGATAGAPAAPLKLAAAAASTSEILLTWQDKATNETSYHLEMQAPGGNFTEIESLPANSTGSPATAPAQGTLYNFRVRAENAGGFSPYSNVASATTDTTPAPCVASATTLCVDDQTGDKRFKVQVSFHTTQGAGAAGPGTALPLSTLGVNRGGLFWFFSADNPEMLIKILNNCAGGGRYWVFYAAGTNVGLTTTVTDTVTGHMATYVNPDVTPAPPVQDTVGLPCN